MCGRDPFVSIGRDVDTLKKSINKLTQVINFDFVRRVGQKYFVSNKERGSFSRAAEFCSQRGLELALPQNEDENSSLTEVFWDDLKTVWINFNNKKAEGAVDMETRPLIFTKWGEGQPDQSVQESGCTMLSENSIWRVTDDCFLNAYIICQL
ncbi:mannose-binding protein C-like [Embiotoca jacksoni]|uniref:mannose-binding protein C-like n=1 Tax=Embiotoca jacksoni TaxID=100190 RepID=UPI0037047AA6